MSLKQKIAELKDVFVAKFNALNTSKANDADVLHKTGNETKDGSLGLKTAWTISPDLTMGRIIFPQGGQKWAQGNNIGALRITVPKAAGVVDFTIILNLHSLNNLSDTRAIISGRGTSTGIWAWQSAIVITNQSEDYTVRYGNGANGEYYIYLGELTKNWKTLTVNIESVYTNSYGTNTVQGSLEGWAIDVVQSFENISQTVENTFPWGDWNKLKGKPNNLALLSDIPSLSGYALESWVSQQIANLVDSSPVTLDTLNEIAAALGDDPDFSTTILNLLAGKVSKAGDVMTGTLEVPKVLAGNGAIRLELSNLTDNASFPRGALKITSTSSNPTNYALVVSNDNAGLKDTTLEVINSSTYGSDVQRTMIRSLADAMLFMSAKGNGNLDGAPIIFGFGASGNKMIIDPDGSVTFPGLLGTGDRIVLADPNGKLKAGKAIADYATQSWVNAQNFLTTERNKILDIQIEAANIFTLYTKPITLIESQGKTIIVTNVAFQMKYEAPAHEPDGNIYIGYEAGSSIVAYSAGWASDHFKSFTIPESNPKEGANVVLGSGLQATVQGGSDLRIIVSYFII